MKNETRASVGLSSALADFEPDLGLCSRILVMVQRVGAFVTKTVT